MTASDIIGTAPDQTADLPMFAAQREASPEVARPVARMAMPGPSTHARAIAKEKADRSLTGRRGIILATLKGHGPMDRWQLHLTTGLSENSVNSAVNNLMTSGHVVLLPAVDPVSKRSVVAINPEAP